MKLLRRAAPPLRFVGLILLLAGTFAYAKFQGGRVSWTVFYMLLPFLLYGILLFVYPLRDIGFRRELERRELPFGGSAQAEITLTRRFPFPLLYVSVKEETKEGDPARNPALLFLWGFRRRKKWSYRTGPLGRGEHALEGVTVEVSDFFGWMKKSVFLPSRETVLVLPKVLGIRHLPTVASDGRGAAAAASSAVMDPAAASGIREYEPGDRVSRIHWSAFARTGDLYTKEFEDRRSQDLFLILDGRPSGTFEAQVSLAASLLKLSVENRAVAGFVTLGPAGAAFPLVEGLEGHHDVLRHLARFHPAEEGGSIPHEGRGLIGTARTMIVVTGRISAGWVERLLGESPGVRSGLLYSVLAPGERPDGEALAAAKKASAQGLDVRFVTERDFETAQTEGRAS